MNTLPKFPRKSFWWLFAIMLLAGTFIWQLSVGAQSKRSTVSPGVQQLAKQTAKMPLGPAPASGLRYWTSAGATATADEDSAAIVSYDDFAAQLKDTLTGTVTVRYNITAVKGVSAFCPATQSVVNVRFRNSDNTGVHAQVKFEIHRTHILNGGNDIIYSFNSNGLGAGNAFTTVSAAPNIDFDFSNYVYWIEGIIYRDQAAQFADLGAIEIYESAGTTPCP
jgi:hypothetical protein